MSRSRTGRCRRRSPAAGPNLRFAAGAAAGDAAAGAAAGDAAAGAAAFTFSFMSCRLQNSFWHTAMGSAATSCGNGRAQVPTKIADHALRTSTSKSPEPNTHLGLERVAWLDDLFTEVLQARAVGHVAQALAVDTNTVKQKK